ncbi:carboxylesterase [Shewanella sp. Scap07]|uniref:alpha/beta hydrolase n=1 Tax=Shewanella sp. Scap07 TaxID=2589987 RepID=UPI0015BB6B77|nr:carboxylesterase [Shewanella sp. Scap07]QLE87791.1 carboxylesterase [Shewanella sp. Scap07]
MSGSTLERITIEPETQAKACVIWLHGLGDSGAGFSPIVPALNMPAQLGVRFIFPHAPEQAVTINQGYVMRSWYDIKGMDIGNRAFMPDVLASEKHVRDLIDEQIAAGIASDKIVLAGFSQGGVMSLFTGLRYEQPLAGILAMSCYLATGESLPEGLSDSNKATPLLQHHGEQDEVVPFMAGKMAFDALKAAGYDTQWQQYAMGHSVVPEQIGDISQWLIKRLS